MLFQEFIAEPAGVIPVHLDVPGAAAPQVLGHPITAISSSSIQGGIVGGTVSPDLCIAPGDSGDFYDYGSDYGSYDCYFRDDTGYFGDNGNYDNSYDSFDGYSGVDSGTTTDGTAPHQAVNQDGSTTPYFVHSQSSGNLTKFVDGIGTPVGTGYSGDQTYYNNPDAQSYKSEGPIPQGEYDLTTVDNHKGPLTIELSPSENNEMFGRDNFLIHGDNSSLNHTASEGCIILSRDVRQAVVDSNITRLIVTH